MTNRDLVDSTELTVDSGSSDTREINESSDSSDSNDISDGIYSSDSRESLQTKFEPQKSEAK